MFFYTQYRLRIASEIHIPELCVWQQGSIESADVTIRAGEIPKDIRDSFVQTGPYCYGTEDTLLLDIPNIACYLIKKGQNIVYQSASDATKPQDIRAFILGSCFGALLMQRNILTLHGNAFRYGDGCVICVGYSTAGKSSLAASLMQEGFDILSDDVCAITPHNEVIPGHPFIKLNEDIATELNIDTSDLKLVRANLDGKYSLPLGASYCDQVLPIKAIYELTPCNAEKVSISPIKHFDRFATLQKNTYRNRYVKAMKKTAEHLKQCTSLSVNLHIASIQRPVGRLCINELRSKLLEDLQQNLTA